MTRNKRRNKSAPTLERAIPAIPPQSHGVVIPAHILSAMFAQMQPGGKGTKPNTVLFSPGDPLTPQPGVNPQGQPIQWPFPVGYNISAPDRQMGNQDIPPFQQLRTLARTYDGIGLCERAILDLVPRLKLKIALTEEAIAGGAEEKQYQKEIAFFTNFFSEAGLGTDIHTWIRKAWREQTQIDELYIYKQKDRAGRLLSLDISAGDTFKPLLDVRGRVIAYQQFPRGVPGTIFTPKDMIRYNESPSADTPFGTSRVERIMIRVNQALRKEQKDLARFTEGNIPQGIMQVPESSQWTPDQIDAYEQLWNALIAGQVQQQVRIHFTQPGFEYVKTDAEDIMTEFDQFLLNITTGAYGLSMGDLSFTGDIHKSSGDSQQNMLGRRTLYPLTSMYALLFTTVMRQDFPPEMQGNLLEVQIGGFEESEDLGALSTAYATLAGVGAIAPSDIAHIMRLPEVPNTGPFIMTKTGPFFLKDYEEGGVLRDVHVQAQKAGMQLAAQPPMIDDEEEDNEGDDTEDDNTTQSQQKTKAQGTGGAKKPPAQDTHTRSVTPAHLPDAATRQASSMDTLATDEARPPAYSEGGRDATSPHSESQDYRRWRARAIEDVKAGRSQRDFTSELIPSDVYSLIASSLARCHSVDEVKAVFEQARQTQGAA